MWEMGMIKTCSGTSGPLASATYTSSPTDTTRCFSHFGEDRQNLYTHIYMHVCMYVCMCIYAYICYINIFIYLYV